MLINIESEIGKRRSQAAILRMMAVYERMFFKTVLAALKSQYAESARLVAMGSDDIDQAIINRMFLFVKSFEVNYKRISNYFGKLLLDEVEEMNKSYGFVQTKSFFDEYFASMFSWMKTQMAEKIVGINRTTTRIIRRIITKGRSEGKSSTEIARDIRKKSKITNFARSNNIARTETHTVAMKSLNEAMNTTRLKYEKEWLTAGDERVRSGGKGFNHRAADGERVGQEEYFENTGEPLEYPGDPAGSAGNICRCRCTTLFHTVAVAIWRSARNYIRKAAA